MEQDAGRLALALAAEEIRTMRVRGAAKIGRHAAVALGAFALDWDGSEAALKAAEDALIATRPTAVSLRNAVRFVAGSARRAPAGQRPRALAEAARAFDARAASAQETLGEHGARLIAQDSLVVTHCNSQGALAPMRAARAQGRAFRVVAMETRPWRQGLLTVGDLAEADIPASLAVDSAMWTVLADADVVLVGADTIAANGDVINKIGTAGLALMARERGVPLYVCAETFKIDHDAATGADVVIEERDAAEVVDDGTLPPGVEVVNPVFDVTDARLVSGYVCELGVLDGPHLAAAARKAWAPP